MRPRPVELADEEVLARACELLDRHLFETSVAAEVTALGTTSGFELTIAGLLRLLARFVDHDLAAVLLPGTRTAYVSVANVATRDHYGEFVTAAAGTLTSSGGAQLTAADLDARVADPRGLLLADSEDFPDGAERSRMTTYLSMPLRDAGGSVVAVLALSSASTDAFGGTELATLRVIEGPAAAVIDHARACGQPPSQTLRSCWSWTFVTSHATRPAAPVKPA